jgi:hypothetical protein
VAQVFNLCDGFSHSLERLCHRAEKLMGKDKPKWERGDGLHFLAKRRDGKQLFILWLNAES